MMENEYSSGMEMVITLYEEVQEVRARCVGRSMRRDEGRVVNGAWRLWRAKTSWKDDTKQDTKEKNVTPNHRSFMDEGPLRTSSPSFSL